MEFFNHYLRQKGVSSEIRSILYHIARATKYINFSLRAGNTGKLELQNFSGETQLKLDVMADRIIAEELCKSGLAACIASEEQDEVQCFAAERGKFSIAYDPLDGSSIVDANCSIGSIFGIWEGDHFLGKKGDDIVAACYSIYGPRVRLIIALRGKGTHEFELNDVGEFVIVKPDIKIQKDNTKYFAPGNMRAAQDDPKYYQLIQDWILSGRTLRYSGGMVPDLHHILTKEQGVFVYPAGKQYPNGKLRMLFECAPFSLIFEESGGASLNQQGVRVLETPITDIHQRTTIFIGSERDVERSVKALA